MNFTSNMKRRVAAFAAVSLLGAAFAVQPTVAHAATPSISHVEFERQVVQEINRQRQAPHKCGSYGWFSKAAPVKQVARLDKSANAHSRDMAKKNYFAHVNPSGKTPWAWIREAGYKYRAAGETLAGGFTDPKVVVAQWLASPGHCKILMNKTYTQVGVGFAMNSHSKYRYYTTAHFATPR